MIPALYRVDTAPIDRADTAPIPRRLTAPIGYRRRADTAPIPRRKGSSIAPRVLHLTRGNVSGASTRGHTGVREVCTTLAYMPHGGEVCVEIDEVSRKVDGLAIPCRW
eukprot:3635846-Prymnesium_polylepis.1